MKRREFVAGSIGLFGAGVPLLARGASIPCPPPTIRVSDGNTAQTADTICSAPTWLKGKSVFDWISLQAPSASGAIPSPVPPGSVSAVTDAWGGGAVRASGSFFILHGGGHGDYGGNEIYALKLADNLPRWSRVWGPTPTVQITQGTHYYGDGNPASIHTFYFMHFDDVSDRLMRFAKSWYVSPSGMARGVDAWSWGASAWLPAGSFPDEPTNGGTEFANGGGTAMDTSGNVYMTNNFNWYVWTRSTNKWSFVASNYPRESNSMVYDSNRKCIWSFGGSNSAGGTVLKWSTSNNAISSLSLTGAAAGMINRNGMGAAYDPVADRVFIYPGTGQLYMFDPSSLSVSLVSTTGATPAGTTVSGTSANLPWNKFRYVPELGGVVFQPEWAVPTVFLRTH